MKRPPEPKPTARNSRSGAAARQRDLDLTAALLRERRALHGESASRPHGGRRPALRTGGRIRMDAPKSTNGGPRHTPIPGAPRYRRNRKPTNWIGIFVGTVCAIGASVGLFTLLTSKVFLVHSVDITGVAPARAVWLRQRLPFDPVGSNVFCFMVAHGRATEQFAASARPNFESAAIGIRLPNVITLQIVKRQPFALLSIGPGGVDGEYILDNRGVPILSAGKGTRPIGIPTIELIESDDSAVHAPAVEVAKPPIVQAPVAVAVSPPPTVVLGQLPAPDLAARISAGYELLRAVRGDSAIGPVVSIDVDKFGDVGFKMASNLRIRLGQPTQLGDKLSLVSSLLAQHPEIVAQAQYIDVSYIQRPAMMPKAAANANGSSAAPTASPAG